jgi:hypothetical protein
MRASFPEPAVVSMRSLFLLVVVGLLLLMLVFTDTGQSARRRAARMLGFAPAAAEIDYGAINPEILELEVPTAHLDLAWSCDRSAGLGDRECVADVSSVNGIPATSVLYVFEKNHLKFVRVGYAGDQFDELVKSLDASYPRGASARSSSGAGERISWRAGQGIAMSEPEPTPGGEVMLLWTPSHRARGM